MPRSLEKKKILESTGFSYHFDREIYFNRETKKVFSVEAIEDNDPEWLNQKINEENNRGEWLFYFNDPASDAVKEEIRELLEG